MNLLTIQLPIAMNDHPHNDQRIADLQAALRDFAKKRDWGQYHTPKNLAMALSVETAEVVELFQWLTQEEGRDLSPDQVERLTEEIGDVMIYLTMLADRFGLDPVRCAEEKMVKNAVKYPVKKSE